jgi:flagellar hook assembly protein FlgD
MAHIQYSLPYHFAQAGIVATDPYKVSVALYDIMGRQVRQLVYSMKAPGNYTVAWDGKNNAGLYAATGMYFCRIEANEFNSVKKITVIR